MMLGLLVSVFLSVASGAQTPISDCEVVIIEASLGGTAAALQAARSGAKVCLTSMTDWVGGQLTTQGVSAVDEPSQFGEGDREAVKAFAGRGYSDHPHMDEVTRTMRPWLDALPRRGNCWVGRYCFPAVDGDRALKAQLQAYVKQGKIRILYETVPTAVRMEGARIAAVDVISRRFKGRGARPYSGRLSSEVLDWYDPKPSKRYFKERLTLPGRIFIDGTETGELIAMSRARHELGYVSSDGKVTDPECVMGFVFPVLARAGSPTAKEARELSRFKLAHPHPAFDFDDAQGGKPRFTFWREDRPGAPLDFAHYRNPTDDPFVLMINWGGSNRSSGNDFWQENLVIPEAKLGEQLSGSQGSWKGGIRISALRKAEARSLGYLEWLVGQKAAKARNGGIRPVFSLSDPSNYFGTGTGLAKFPYLRETRRIRGYHGFQIQAAQIAGTSGALGKFPGPGYTDFEDSLGIGSYSIDFRPCPTGRRIESPSGMANHYQIPLRALVSENVSNLMVANKTLAVDQVSNGAFRLHPTEWNAGLGAGAAAAIAVHHGAMTAHALLENKDWVREAQQEVIRAGGRVIWWSDALPVPRPTPF